MMHEWAKVMGFAEPVLDAIRARKLNASSFTHIKSLREVLMSKDMGEAFAIAGPWRLPKVTISKEGALKGLPPLPSTAAAQAEQYKVWPSPKSKPSPKAKAATKKPSSPAPAQQGNVDTQAVLIERIQALQLQLEQAKKPSDQHEPEEDATMEDADGEGAGEETKAPGSKDPLKWTCPSCSAQNNPQAKKCRVCWLKRSMPGTQIGETVSESREKKLRACQKAREHKQKMIDMMDADSQKQSPQLYAILLHELGQVQKEIADLEKGDALPAPPQEVQDAYDAAAKRASSFHVRREKLAVEMECLDKAILQADAVADGLKLRVEQLQDLKKKQEQEAAASGPDVEHSTISLEKLLQILKSFPFEGTQRVHICSQLGVSAFEAF